MNTLGIDMSTNSSGFALFKDSALIEYGRWESPSELLGKENWRQRLFWMADRLEDFINTHDIDVVYCEDVPLINSNPSTLKMLSALQGMIMGVHRKTEFVSVSTWRSDLGLFTGKRKDTTREEMKQSSIDYANEEFGLDLIWKSKTSKFNQDDIADAINVAWSKICPRKRGMFGK